VLYIINQSINKNKFIEKVEKLIESCELEEKQKSIVIW